MSTLHVLHKFVHSNKSSTTLKVRLSLFTIMNKQMFFSCFEHEKRHFSWLWRAVKIQLIVALAQPFTFRGSAVKSKLIETLTSQSAPKSNRLNSALAPLRHQQAEARILRSAQLARSVNVPTSKTTPTSVLRFN